MTGFFVDLDIADTRWRMSLISSFRNHFPQVKTGIILIEAVRPLAFDVLEISLNHFRLSVSPLRLPSTGPRFMVQSC